MNKECVVKTLLEMWICRENVCYLECFNYFEKIDENKFKTTVTEKNYEGEIFISRYEIFISETEFRIIEI